MPVAEQLQHILTSMRQSEARSGRPPQSVRLIAVSKRQSDERIDAALASGQRIFGENYVQEAQHHWTARRSLYPDLELHMIGPLQSNKVKQAVMLFDVIQSIDRPSLVDELARVCLRVQKFPKIFIQVNIGDEPQKSGVSLHDLPSLIALVRSKDLPLAGLMAIPPEECDPVPFFQTMAQLAAEHGLSELSMGMSADFEVAISCGATYVRVGQFLFGARE